MTQRRLVASVAMLLVLVMGMVPTLGRAGESAAVAPAASAPPAIPPAPTPEVGKSVQKLFGNDLFTPAPVPRCQAGACWNNSQCPDGAECFFSQPGACGICLF